MNLTRAERETIVRRSDADDFCVISTASPKYIRKFIKLGYQTDDMTLNPEEYRSFKVPLSLISFRRPRKKLSRVEIANRMRNLRRAGEEETTVLEA